MKWHQIMGREDCVQADFGLELEVESSRPNLPVLRGSIDTKRDGSLRNVGFEYVTKALNYDCEGRSVIDTICSALSSREVAAGIIRNSPRTSLHVHINAQKYDFLSVFSAALIWWLFEDYIVEKTCKPCRHDNHFCLPISKAQALQDVVGEALTVKNLMAHLNDDNIKYSGQNLYSLAVFGTVENRFKHFTLDADEIWHWVGALVGLMREATARFPNPGVLGDVLATRPLSALFIDIFGRNNPAIPFNAEEIQRKCGNSLSFVLGICHRHNDWSTYQQTVEEYYTKELERKKKRAAQEEDGWRAVAGRIAAMQHAEVRVRGPIPPEQVFIDDLQQNAPEPAPMNWNDLELVREVPPLRPNPNPAAPRQGFNQPNRRQRARPLNGDNF